MMKLELMERFFESVDEEWRSPLASSIATLWFGDGAETWVWRASANFVCVLADADKKYYLRFNHESERRSDLVTAELAFVEKLAEASIPVAMPLRSCSNKLVESVDTPTGLMHAVVFEAAPGEHRPFESLTEADFETWGRALGAVHACSTRLSTIGRPDWSDNLRYAAHHIPPEEELAWRELRSVEDRLGALEMSADVYGLIHYDFELDNLMWQDGRISILDFDDCAYYWFAADIAYALRDLFEDRVGGIDLGDPTLQAFVHGYRFEQPISDEELVCMPLYLRLHNLVSFARIARSLGREAGNEEPEWALSLRHKLQGTLDDYRQDFAECPIRQMK